MCRHVYSKSFYLDGAPKLALPKLDPGRPDTAVSSTLRKQGSGTEREASRLSGAFPGLEATLGPTGTRGRQTTAETVAVLKANLGGDTTDFSFARPIATGSTSQSHSRGSTSDGPQPPESSGRASSASSAMPSSAFLSTAGTATSSASGHHASNSPSGGHLGSEFSYGVYIEGGEGPLLDPRRNDDLPPRPGTSRGRPGSAALSDMDPITERYPGPPPGVQDLGNGAQVLDMSAFAQYSDDEENDFDVSTGGAPLEQQQQQQQGAKQAEAAQQGASRQGGAPVRGRPAQAPQAATGGGGSAAATNWVDMAGPADDPEFLAWRNNVEGLLTDLTASISGKAGSSALCSHAGKLVGLVEDARRREHSSRWLNSPSAVFRDGNGTALSLREAISEHAFRLMDSSNSELLMKACAIVLRVVKSRLPLLQTAKLLYRLSKDGSNDVLFRREGLLEPLVHTVHIMVASVRGSHNPANMHEPLVYMNGCLKNISNEAHNQKTLVKLGTLHVLSALLMQMADQAKSGDEGLAESCGQVAVQVSGVLRNLAVPSHNASAFLAAGVLPALRVACSALSGHVEVVLNAGRILSKLSLHEGCQAAIGADGAYAPLLVQLLGQYADNRAILLRVAFVLGNLTTTSNECREQVCNVPFAFVTVVGILQRYAFGGPGGEGGSGGSSANDRLSRAASHEDCLVKVLRLAANLAIWPDAGHTLAEEAHVADALLHLLEAYSFEAAEELVLNTVCALTNLSYYQSEMTPGGFTNKVLQLPPSRLMPRITPLLMCDNEEAVIEAARVYGNFSRSPEVRDYMQAARVVEALVLLLDHSNAEVLYSVCGTLVNFTMDASRKHVLGALGGTSRLVEVLGRTVAQGELGDRDEAIIDVVCKALFNVASADDGPGVAGPAASGDSSAFQGSGSTGQSSSGFTREEVAEVLSLVEALEASGVADCEEMASVLGRLAAQMRRLQQRMVSAELEALPE
ncbi:hypothetical protein Vretimale_474 [Volvox reticuliferus]|uniref:Uncharacterized protein n=1 Tax=Volvox reticuliferus TaxID=1737510 RepID=A0A8J4D3C9_9CHLO|nr:hypothetical protein Vretimale_474 [Volvox reticuliferus]